MLIGNPLNSSELAFPVLECIHILAFAFSAGTAAIVDLRLIGIGMTDQSPSDLWKDTSLWTLLGLIVVVFSGLLLFSSDPDNYYLNYAFLLKMACLLLAVVHNYTAVRKAASGAATPANGRLVGSVALFFWACVVFGGIFIGFLNSTLDSRRV